MESVYWPVFVPIVAIIGWVVVSVANALSRARVREL